MSDSSGHRQRVRRICTTFSLWGRSLALKIKKTRKQPKLAAIAEKKGAELEKEVERRAMLFIFGRHCGEDD